KVNAITSVTLEASKKPQKLLSRPSGFTNDVKPISDPTKAHIFTCIKPVIKPPTAADSEAIKKMRPYFKLMPYMAGSVTPQKAEIAAGPASSLILGSLVFTNTAKTAPPWATIVAEISAFKFEEPVCEISWVTSGITAQCRPKITKPW